MSATVHQTLSSLLLPPAAPLLLIALGVLLLMRRRRSGGARVAWAGIALLWLLSTPLVAESLLRSLEPPPLPAGAARPEAAAVVVLGGGSNWAAAEEDAGESVSEWTLQRLRYGVRLARETGRPLLVTGGRPMYTRYAEAQLMRHVAEREFHTPVRWVEGDSDNTFENARLSFGLLAPEGRTTVYLVTHGWHMPRARRSFERAGFRVVPAATGYTPRARSWLAAIVPTGLALRQSAIFSRELLGLAVYSVTGRI